MILGFRDDHLAHYVVGAPVSTMASVFPLEGSGVGVEMGKELRSKVDELYRGADPLVREKLLGLAKPVDQDTFDESYHPSLAEGGNYLSLTERYLSDCADIRRLMGQKKTDSSIKPNLDEKYFFDRYDLTNAMREFDYHR